MVLLAAEPLYQLIGGETFKLGAIHLRCMADAGEQRIEYFICILFCYL